MVNKMDKTDLEIANEIIQLLLDVAPKKDQERILKTVIAFLHLEDELRN